MKALKTFNLSSANEWLLSLTIDEINALYKKYEDYLLEMDSNEILDYLYFKEKNKETAYNYTNLIN